MANKNVHEKKIFEWFEFLSRDFHAIKFYLGKIVQNPHFYGIFFQRIMSKTYEVVELFIFSMEI